VRAYYVYKDGALQVYKAKLDCDVPTCALTKSQSAVASLSARKPTGPMRRALAKVGRDCVGALQFLHEGQEPGLAGAVAGRRAVGDEEIGSRSATSP